MKNFSQIGKSLPRPDAKDKVTGKTKFLDDIQIENVLHAYPVVSSIPFGKILNIDYSEANNHEDFVAIYFAKDIVGKNQVGVIIEDQLLLAETIVRFIGDVIGIIVARNLDSARKLSKMVKIDYQKFDPYFSINSSKSATHNFIHSTNIACTHRVINGEIETGFKKSDYIVEASFKTPYQEHYYLEPQSCIAIPDKNSITIYGSLQCPFYVQKAVSITLGYNFKQVRVIQTPTGGAFGGKEDIPSEVCARAALAAVLLNKPVKTIYGREDDIQYTSKRHPFQMNYKVGVSKTGKLLAAEILLEENAGAFATLSTVVSYRSAMQAMGPYVIPNIHVESFSYYTNLPPAGAFRGFGSPQATFGHERMMDTIAAKLEMDPLEFRLANILKAGTATQTGQLLTSSVGAEQTLLKSSHAAGWNQNIDIIDDRYRYGLGIASCHYGNCLGAAGWHMDGSAARIQIHRDGSVNVSYGLIDMGQGAITVVTQMTAEALGINPDRISVFPTDSLNVPDSGPSVASRNVVMTGNAILNAAQQITPILLETAADALDCNVQDIKLQNDIALNNKTNKSITFSDLSELLYQYNKQMDILGWWHVRPLQYDPKNGLGEAYYTYSYATHIAQVKVDTITGIIHLEKVWAAHDVGKAINPAGIEGQVEGGVAQGAGWALTEDFIFNDGEARTTNLSTYLLPTTLDSTNVETIIIEESDPDGPWGAKGIGEPAIIPTAAAITNAVSNALGYQFNEIPLTPEIVLNAIERNKLKNS
ncbi:xanthine dehydrogenase family protein molybdopterin-binding subunit [Candidatus Neomarinimicrobiota bacterium]